MNVRGAASIWTIMMNPHNIELEDISNVFFDMVLGVSNMRYFKSQEMAHDYCDEERESNGVLH